MSDKHQSSASFFAAGAALGDVGGCSARCNGRFMSDEHQSSAFFPVRCNIWSSWRMTPDAPRIVLDVSCKTRINHRSQFSWQAQYWVMLEV